MKHSVMKFLVFSRNLSVLRNMSLRTVQVEQGIVRGCEELLPDGRKYLRFSGIPYAKVPERFQRSQKLLKFDKPEIDCTRERDPCFHKSTLTKQFVGSEDCLNLNVYVPEKLENGAKKFAVIVFIHGGGFKYDSNTKDLYSPEHLLMENIVVVTINYRLHILGFLSLPSKGISGNNALKDQQLALQWIHENIENFNGDPDNICLFGESFGAGCAHLHVLNEKSRKFIKSAICQSGTAMTSNGFREYSTHGDVLKLGKLLGCKSESLDDVLETLVKADVKDLYENCEKLPTPYETFTRLRRWRMVIEEESDDAFISKSPFELIKSQAGKIKIPMIFGVNDGDGMPRTAAALKILPQLNEDITQVINHTILSTAVSPNTVASDIKMFYFGGKDISIETLDCLVNFFTDLTYLGYQTVTVDIMAKFHPECKVFLNEFQYDGRLNIQKQQVRFQHMKRACHADDLYYLFGGVLVDQVKLEDDSIEANNRRTICRLWANFAKYGNPTPENKSGLNFKWDSLDLGDMLRGDCNVLALNDEPKMIRNLNKDRMDFFRRNFRYYDVDHLLSKSRSKL